MQKLLSSLIAVAVFAFSNKSFVFCGLYAVFVFAGQHFMRERQKLNLRRPLVLWSLSLAIFRSDICVVLVTMDVLSRDATYFHQRWRQIPKQAALSQELKRLLLGNVPPAASSEL